jgi:hypothetical protein
MWSENIFFIFNKVQYMMLKYWYGALYVQNYSLQNMWRKLTYMLQGMLKGRRGLIPAILIKCGPYVSPVSSNQE